MLLLFHLLPHGCHFCGSVDPNVMFVSVSMMLSVMFVSVSMNVMSVSVSMMLSVMFVSVSMNVMFVSVSMMLSVSVSSDDTIHHQACVRHRRRQTATHLSH